MQTVKKNLIVSLDEGSAGGEQDVVALRTTQNPDIIIFESAVPKLSLNIHSLVVALQELSNFNKVKKEEGSILPTGTNQAAFVVTHGE